MTRLAASKLALPRQQQAQTHIGLRIILAAISLCCVLLAGLSWWNYQAVRTYNRASSSLATNLKEAGQASPDMARLRQSQQQVDAQFEQARKGPLLPQSKQAIDHNADLSRKLTQALKKQEEQEHKLRQAKKKDQQALGQLSSLSPDERRKIEDMLSQNQKLQAHKPADTDKGSGQPSSKDQDKDTASKPW